MDDFYAELPAFADFHDIANADVYVEVPDGWNVVITDVRGSTKAIEAGRYKEVNILGAASIVAALNALDRVQVPYVFGGDGATLLVPDSQLHEVGHALLALAEHAEGAYGLGLRVGVVPMDHLHGAGHSVRIAKYAASNDVVLAMFNGGGIAVADALIKAPETADIFAVKPTATLPPPDLDGLHCRWNPIESRHGRMISVLVVATAQDEYAQAETYLRVLHQLETLAKDVDLRPSNMDMTLATDAESLDAEASIKTGRRASTTQKLKRVQLQGEALMGTSLMATGKAAGGFDGKTYLGAVVANTDFRKFDDCLRMVLDVPNPLEAALRAYLEEERQQGHVAYGIHASDTALMTCIVFDFDANHVHFVDGGSGGYAMAAKGLKAQLSSD